MKKYLLAGLLVWMPLAITIWVLYSALGLVDRMFAGIVAGIRTVFPWAPVTDMLDLITTNRVVGWVVMFLAVLATGVFAANIVGQWALRQGDRVLSKIPIVKSIYNSVKQVSDTLFSSSGNAFREAVLLEYPRRGAWTIAFVTGKPGGEAATMLTGDYISVYVPTTPNPTSGFFLMVPRADVMPLNMSVDEALKYVISMGVVAPPSHEPQALPPNQSG